MPPLFNAFVKLKPVFILLGLCPTVPAAALGLGEIDVRSHLGQPLHATVTLLDAPADPSAACFSLGASEDGIAPPPRAQLSIQQDDGKTLLHIRTLQPVDDPIAQFVLRSECDVRLQRDYVVLLDPPPLATLAASQETPAVAAQAAAATAEPTAAPTAEPAPPRASRPPRKKIRPAPAASQRPAMASPRQPAAAAARPAAVPMPRLVLSGQRNAALPTDAPIALRRDTRLPDPARARPANLNAADLSDENTALARKLAHLEAQLLALQKRNAELEARRAAAPTAIPPAADRPARWPVYLLIAGLGAAGIALLAWLLRRRPARHQTIAMDDTPWTQSDDSVMARPGSTAGAAPRPQPAPARMPDVAPPPRDEGTEVKEDILDQAEVFMAHGHSELAVHLLQEHLRAAPAESPVPWLLLLDLLRRAGDTAAYAAASTECRRYFNIKLAGHPVSQDGEASPGLEAYPHLLEQLVKAWNTADIDAFFHDLVYDNRSGTRVGFEPGAYREILLLRAIAQDVQPRTA